MSNPGDRNLRFTKNHSIEQSFTQQMFTMGPRCVRTAGAEMGVVSSLCFLKKAENHSGRLILGWAVPLTSQKEMTGWDSGPGFKE